MQDTVFSKQKLFIEKDISTIVRALYALNPKKFSKHFADRAKIKVDTPTEVDALVDLMNKGLDKKGYVKDYLGRPVAFDTFSLIKEISVDESDLKNIQFID